MNTKFSRLCEAIIEAGWLAALIVVPLFFNVHSSRVFEPDKLSLLRSIALIMAVAWLAKLVNEGLGSRHQAGRGGPEEPPTSFWQRVRSTPLVLPTLALVLVYLISTLLSIHPRVSWWGSYQRLQGTYTTYSYILIFFLVLGHLRRPEQWRRIAYVIILTSLPISIYGMLQKTGLDPLPWGGNVQRRVASNMGNAIFVAAYLLMAFFITLERLLVHFGRLLQDEGTKAGLADAVLAGCFLFIIVVQFVTMILFTQSRGPFLGWAAGLYIFALIGLLGLRAAVTTSTRLRGPLRGVLRWGWLGTIGLAVIGVAFLVVFNLPNSPLAPLRKNPYIGRLGTALDFESNTAQVRLLIWEGVTKLVSPHEPLQYPATGGGGEITAMKPDRFNVLRPLIGYGPETMWVAYNRFYPPDLAHHESRNASPDRSHNETFDSLVITGAIGFIAYITLFMSLFYHALKWLGLMRGERQRNLFLLLAVIGGLLGAILPYLIQGSWVLLGLGLPTGLIVGIILYVTIAAISNERQGLPMHMGRRELLIMTILATVVAHFVEIHFGIAIAATRTYFWIWSAILVTTGLGWLKLEAPTTPEQVPVTISSAKPAEPNQLRSRSHSKRRRRRRASAPPPSPPPAKRWRAGPWSEVVVYAVLLGIILFTLAYDFTVNATLPTARDTSALPLFWHSLTSRIQGNMRITSLGVLWMIVFTWLVGLAVALGIIARNDPAKLTGRWLAGAVGIYSGLSSGIFLVLGLIHASNLARDARAQTAGSGFSLDQISDMAAGHIGTYYLLLFLLMALLSLVIWRTRPGEARWLSAGNWFGPLVGVALAVAAGLFISAVNVSLVKADIIYKQGQAYDSAKRYNEAIFLYQKAIKEEPNEDYYYLFLGRAQLERARQANGEERQRFLKAAEQSLIKAQELNPLNTDHTANLGRLYLTWAQMINDPQQQQALLRKALDYYQVATSLSPNAAHLHNEYGTAYQLVGDYDKALEQFEISLSLDQEYADTYRRLGELYRAMGKDDLAIEAFEKGLELAPRDVQLHSTLGYMYAQRGELDKAIEHNLAVLQRRPNDLASNRNLAILYQQAGDPRNALVYAQKALQLTKNESEKPALEALIKQLQQQLGS